MQTANTHHTSPGTFEVTWAGATSRLQATGHAVDMVQVNTGAHAQPVESHDAAHEFAVRADQDICTVEGPYVAGPDAPERATSQHNHPAWTLDTLSAALTATIVKRVTLGPVLHAASFRWKNLQWLAPGECGVGKSTLTAWAWLELGAHLGSDEAVAIDPDGVAHAWHRPLHIKPGPLDLLARWHVADRLASGELLGYLHEGHAWVRPGQTSPLAAPVDVVILPQFDPDSPPACDKLPPARAAQQLLRYVANTPVDDGALPKEVAFRVLTELVSRVPVYRLTYGDFEILRKYFDELVGA